MTGFETFVEAFREVFQEAQTEGRVKLLNVGSNNAREYHWRFRLDGEIVNVSVEKEE